MKIFVDPARESSSSLERMQAVMQNAHCTEATGFQDVPDATRSRWLPLAPAPLARTCLHTSCRHCVGQLKSVENLMNLMSFNSEQWQL